uniref:Uncharacterized protein n=1 Tax=Eubacterium plexicaudatum ASF492 TaxID=1235802 RepID=N2ARW0_9FIRM
MGRIEAFDRTMIGDGCKIAVYGMSPCGKLAKKAIELLGGKIDVFIDRLRDAEFFEGVPVMHFEEIRNIHEYRIINCASANFRSIAGFLFDQGIETVYHALSLLDLVPEDDKALEMCDARSLYRYYIENGRGGRKLKSISWQSLLRKNAPFAVNTVRNICRILPELQSTRI